MKTVKSSCVLESTGSIQSSQLGLPQRFSNCAKQSFKNKPRQQIPLHDMHLGVLWPGTACLSSHVPEPSTPLEARYSLVQHRTCPNHWDQATLQALSSWGGLSNRQAEGRVALLLLRGVDSSGDINLDNTIPMSKLPHLILSYRIIPIATTHTHTHRINSYFYVMLNGWH